MGALPENHNVALQNRHKTNANLRLCGLVAKDTTIGGYKQTAEISKTRLSGNHWQHEHNTNAAIEAMLDLPPLHLFVRQEALATAVRLKTQNLWRMLPTAHSKILTIAAEKESSLLAISDKIPKQFIFDNKYKIQLREYTSEHNSVEDLLIFTDGSKTGNGTGAGVLNINISQPLGPHNTVFQAECLGLLLAASAIIKRNVTNYSIRILSDSKAALMAIKSHEITSGLTLECHLALTKVCDLGNSLVLQWIKGHSSSRGNDAADILARRASETPVMGPFPIIPLPASWTRMMITQLDSTAQRAEWSSRSDCKQAREALPDIDSRLARRLLNLRRVQLRVITGTLTGHGPFNKHLFNLGITDSPLCRACMATEETAAHVIMECKGVAEYRARYLGSPGSLPEAFGNPHKLLGFMEELGYQF
ncbi:uncharacterized protein LOC123703686 [Colias croceus]|uniref:uncharacterized protein LOC123703686 n=1 Tax=Colias crocea TaxID=72248 RepID=UPI001E27B273|nr:uncharacterized protein LOC123703686 [Colias croceus]